MDLPFAFEQIEVTNWAYLSSLLMLALFFKFNRFWSIRNLDLLLIILFAPGVLMVVHGDQVISSSQSLHDPGATTELERPVTGNAAGSAAHGESSSSGAIDETSPQTLVRGQRLVRGGYIWLFCVGAVFLLRLLLDPLLVRKPLLDPNLTVGGLVFLTSALMVFSFSNIIKAQAVDLSGARGAVKLVQREAAEEGDTARLRRHGPGYGLFHLFPVIPTFSSGQEILETDADHQQNLVRYEAAAKALAMIGQIAIVVALIFIGNFHFHNFLIGTAMATIYLMLPYTSVYAGHVLHVLPAALLVWGVVFYRQPGAAGLFIGSAIGVAYYPLFLLPLWISFYWEKGFSQFLTGTLISVACCVVGLVFSSRDVADFLNQLIYMFGFWWPLTDGLMGVWGLGWDPWFRVPILVAFIALSISFAFWPIRKTVGTLIAYTAATMVAVQFWHGFGGGLYIAWFMPLALAAIFRPNLSERDAVNDLGEGILGRKKIRIDPPDGE